MTNSKIVLITGASSGIGAAAVTHLAAQGHHVVAGARRLDRLEQLAGPNVTPLAVDVTDRAAVERFVGTAVDKHGRVDVLINNAGIMPLSRLDSLLLEEWDQMIDVNVRGLLHGIAAALPVFTAQGSGHFITTASIGSHQVYPTSAVYCGTKYAAWAITEGLRQECDPSIRVTTITPGTVASELADTITEPGAAEYMRSFRKNTIGADAIARAMGFAIDEPADVDVSEIVVRPTQQR